MAALGYSVAPGDYGEPARDEMATDGRRNACGVVETKAVISEGARISRAPALSPAARRALDRIAPLPPVTSPALAGIELRTERNEILSVRDRRGLTPGERMRLREIEARLSLTQIRWVAP